VSPETAILLKCQKGDGEAFRDFFRLYQRYVYALCFSFTYDREEALDLCQEAFLRVFKGIKSFREEYPVKPWLRRIVVNLCINHLRTRSANPDVELYGHRVPGEAQSNPVGPAGFQEGDPVARAESGERIEMIREALTELTPEGRLAIVLRHQENLGYEEISRVTGWPLGTVKTHLFRARKDLKEKLKELQMEI